MLRLGTRFQDIIAYMCNYFTSEKQSWIYTVSDCKLLCYWVIEFRQYAGLPSHLAGCTQAVHWASQCPNRCKLSLLPCCSSEEACLYLPPLFLTLSLLSLLPSLSPQFSLLFLFSLPQIISTLKLSLYGIFILLSTPVWTQPAMGSRKGPSWVEIRRQNCVDVD